MKILTINKSNTNKNTSVYAKFNNYCKCLSKITSILLTVKDEKDLFHKICSTLIEVMNYKLIWVGIIKDDQFEIKHVVHNELEKNPLLSYEISKDSIIFWPGLTSGAIKQRKPLVIKNIKENTTNKQWRQEALSRGFLSMMAVPLIYNNDVVGVITIYSEKADDFDSGDVNFLVDLALNFAVGIKTIESEKLLVSSAKRYKELISLLPEIILETDFEGNITFANDLGYKKSGYSKTDIIKGLNMLQVLIPEDRKRASDNFQRRLRGEEIGFIEYTAQQKDGKRFICLVGSNVVKDEAGKITGTVNVILDVSKLRETEKRIFQSEQEKQAILDSLTQPLLYHDKKMKIQWTNTAAKEKFHLNLNKTADHQCYKLIHNRNKPIKDCPIIKTLKTGEFQSSEVTFPDGKIYLIIGYPVKDSKGVTTNAVELFLDLTDIRKSEKLLKESEQKYRMIVENQTDFIVRIDSNGRVLYISPSYCKAFGITESESPGKNHLARVHKEDRKLTKAALLETKSPSGSGYFEHRVKSEHGWRWVAWSINGILDKKGNIGEIVATGRDVTDKKMAEVDLEMSHEKTKKILQETIKTLASIVEIKDPYTSGHQQKVAQIAVAIAQEIGLEKDRIQGLNIAAIIHDIGKIAIPASILSKPGKISDLEFEMIKTHSETGYEMLKNIDFPWPVAEIVLQHHERINGTGYPNGLKGNSILLEAKILAVADVLESMTSHRPYRPSLGLNIAVKELQDNKGILYDPKITDACIKLLKNKTIDIFAA